MGYALAEELAGRGAHVILVSGPVSLKPVHKNIELHAIHTAHEMLESCLAVFHHTHGAILAAAVADYRPKSPAGHKIKRQAGDLVVHLEPNPDIAATLGQKKQKGQVLAGFALETDNELSNAQDKLARKNFDFIVLNSLKDEGSGFNTDTNKVTLIGKDNKISPFELKTKARVAADIIDYFEKLLH